MPDMQQWTADRSDLSIFELELEVFMEASKETTFKQFNSFLELLCALDKYLGIIHPLSFFLVDFNRIFA